MTCPDDNEDRTVYGRSRRTGEPPVPRCKLCGSTDVRWRQQGGRWVLFSMKPGIEHVCAILDEFDELE